MSAELSTRSPEQVIHLTLREGLSAIYLPQVIRPMSHMRSRGHDVCLLVFSAVGDYLRPLLRRRWQEQQARAGAAGLKLIRLPCPPARAPRLWSEVSVLRRWLTRNRTRNRRSLHCRGPLATDIALSACAGLNGVEVVFDCRGLIGAEYLYERGHLTPDTAPVEIRTQAARLEAIERSCAQRSQRVICVSEAMKRHLIESWQITEAKISVVPCCTDTAEFARDPQRRIQMRQHLGIDNKFVLVYSGSMAAWQMPHESAVLFREVQRRRPDAHLLVISRQADAFNTMLKDIGLRNGSWTTVAASNDQVREYLWAGDV
ncbi:MAG: glycosyltransferase, partial [Xanthomonadales bacterium]|nr:glycosyltransferase [Xanthomonadales bacterium]